MARRVVEQQRSLLSVLLIVVMTLAVMAAFPYLLPFEWRNLAPPVGLAMMFFWRFHRHFPLWAVVLCGLIFDIHQAMPLGTGISAALLLAWISQRHKGQDAQARRSFTRNWGRFFRGSLLAMGWVYALMCFTQQVFYPPAYPFLQWLALVITYPLIYRFCHAMLQALDPAYARRLS